ncbi:MAG: hydrolase TatD [Crocinitomicaceae bacterium]|nr:hydrolase TatD [Crocinitomicaceae bacterium]
MNNFFIDSHTHLYLPEFSANIEKTISSCKDLNIQKLLLPNIDSLSIQPLLHLCATFPDICYPMIGLHPCSVKENYLAELTIIESYLKNHNIIAIGEIGIDLYWDKTSLEIQKEAFITQLNWAKKYSLPIVIHARDSFNELFEVLDFHNDDNLTGVFHCFTGDVHQANKIIDYGGFKLGVGGVVTFKNAGLDKTLSNISLEHLILETDAPYLAPHPYRGKQNCSTNVILIAEKLATIYQCSLENIASTTTKNTIDVFKL